MFSSSVRRVARAAPSVPITPSLSGATPRTIALSYRSHQRRLSSSKPSSPADGSTPPAARVSKKKAREVAANATVKGRDASLLHLPSVPSTQHVPEMQIYASSFFSLHRPISLTKSFPQTVTDDTFAAIFTPRIRVNKPSEVISTLTNTVKNLDSITGKKGAGRTQQVWNEERDDMRAAITEESYRQAVHLDTLPENAAEFTKQLMSSGSRYKPFNPPPPPEPMNSAESLAAGAEAAEALEPQHRTYTAVLTIEESTDENGEVTYSAHSSPLIEEAPRAGPTKFLERMQIRQERYRDREQRRGGNDMLAISVKRQRKLKMKKHKYKKLMRRTRNLRRRLDRN
ncbi:uncharacterized protein LY89DRAFT_703330 [Mollisia scopiformis]|uniref:Small ribosomal subunit protein mS38 n=1 Tax=Mollisia scopiformis TaxID=149040 RepID=A0A194XVT3_MOLSC|nr:uncharacterized protein LY89DRAFT_703330 [Mollisia scopiformis]KUJ24119.1 hypothetical protein LY89DRAFT_703330 [Mollisia scopiformis]